MAKEQYLEILHTWLPLAALPSSSTCSVCAIAASSRHRTSPCCCDSPVIASASEGRSPACMHHLFNSIHPWKGKVSSRGDTKYNRIPLEECQHGYVF